jgi:hypothetical protein
MRRVRPLALVADVGLMRRRLATAAFALPIDLFEQSLFSAA